MGKYAEWGAAGVILLGAIFYVFSKKKGATKAPEKEVEAPKLAEEKAPDVLAKNKIMSEMGKKGAAKSAEVRRKKAAAKKAEENDDSAGV